MKWVFILLISGCTVKSPNLTVFLKEKNTRIYSLSGRECITSGYYITPILEGQYRLVTVFENCDVRHERILDEMEIKQWIKSPT